MVSRAEPSQRTAELGFDCAVASGLRTAYSKSVLHDHLLNEFREQYKEYKDVQALPYSHWKLPRGDHAKHDSVPSHPERICIVGAGMAGLHTAMLLKEAGFYNIDIYEASDRLGGRMFTYKFPEPKDREQQCLNNYCDIGAMRLPKIPRMDSTFRLIDALGLKGKLREYIYNIKAEPFEPNLWGFKNKSPQSDDFDLVLKNFFMRFNFTTPGKFSSAFQKFMSRNLDEMSTRTWLMMSQHFTYEETVTAEASDTSTGLFDQALIETICDYVDFQTAKGADWFRIDGGMKVIIDAMVEELEAEPRIRIHMNTPIKALIDNELDKKQGDKSMTVVTKDGQEHKYTAVFNTTAMPCLQRMDLSRLGLPDDILTGIRTLSYDRATKVAIKFSRPWWRDYLKSEGGVSSTDLPISKIVYPSWTEDDKNACVLLASYSWAQDATRMGALFQNSKSGAGPESKPEDEPGDKPGKKPGKKPKCEEEVVTLCLENLAQVWSKVPGYNGPRTVEELRALYVDHFAYAWSHDPNQGGAYALFGPGQFRYVYPRFLKLQCEGKFVMVGEALSHEHAWISGAINSAEWGVTRWLCQNEYDHSCRHLKKSNFAIYLGSEDETQEEKIQDAMDEELLYWSMKLGEGLNDKEKWKAAFDQD